MLRTACGFVYVVAALSTRAATADDVPSFNRDVRPILADACFACHGPDPGSRQAGLRLDREADFFTKRGDGAEAAAPVVPGDPTAGSLYRRIMSDNADEVMPPPDAHRQLKPAEKEIIRRWIVGGAKWQPHWSFLAPQRPAPPQVKNDKWVRNPIDRFILAKLESLNLSPAPEADAAAICRRVYLDVTGLPPTPEELAAFLADRSPQAYEKLVDKLLASPRYGEHRARYWLDAARYADTHGLHFDNYREMWPYRDWVINAYNADQPFDQFTIDQIAGDLLPKPTRDQLIATGFHRCNITTNEGGTIADENLAGYARDRVETTSWVWLGLTANCCVCHDHKFDPLTSRDFYAMSAYFRNTTQGSHDGNIKDTKPVLYLPQAEDAPRFEKVTQEIAAARADLDKRRPAAVQAAAVWQRTVSPSEIDLSDEALVVHAPLREGEGNETAITLPGGRTAVVKAAGKLEWRPDGRMGPAPILSETTSFDLGDLGSFDRDEPFSVSLWVRGGDKVNDGVLVVRTTPDGKTEPWKVMLQQGGKLTFLITSADGKSSIRITSRQQVVRPTQWSHIVATYDGSGSDRGMQLYSSGKLLDVSPRNTKLEGSTRVAGTLSIGRRTDKDRLVGGTVQDVRVYGRRLSIGDAQTLAVLNETRAAAAVAPDKRNPQQKEKLTTFFVENRDRTTVPLYQLLQERENERKTIESRAIVTHIQEEKMNSPAMANILVRGQYDKLGEQVKPGVFAALSPLPDDAPPNRLGLAQWLVDKQNPLTARVTVNRFWQEVFGTGLVKTAEDFGIMGETPSHPELLDWLAVEFRDGSQDKNSRGTAWSTKHLLRLILTSAAYRQAATVTPEKLAKDRDNRYLSRGPRFRMDAEMIRDYALTASGTLSPRQGGPSVKPYQPEGLWDIVGLPGGNTRDYQQDAGESLYRRSMYTFWKRMSPPPSMETFNAPSREFSCLRRERTNTPLQALVTLNDPQFVEASRNLAQAALKEAKLDSKKTLEVVAQRVLCRSLQPKEADVIGRALAETLSYYHGHPEDAKALIAVGASKADAALDPVQLAAWTNICNSLLNLDEALNK